MTAPTVGSLFSGIGGLDLGLERAGFRVAWQVESDPFCSEVLARHWPDVPNLGDVRSVAWTEVEPVDVLAGGYPCQPFSLAGQRRGEEDSRHVWPYFADAVRVLRPRLVVLENVPGHLALGFGRVLGDLAALGYDAEWTCVSAAAVGALHLRIRLFVAAYPERDPLRDEPAGLARSIGETFARLDGAVRSVADPDSARRIDRTLGREGRAVPSRSSAGSVERVVHGSDLGADLGAWPVEPDVGRVADGVPARVDRLRALGNAVVPQVAEIVGRAVVGWVRDGD